MTEHEVRVGDVMTTEVFTLRRNDRLAIADDLLAQERVRHLPVLDEQGELCGILSQRDLFRGALLKALGYGARAEQHMLETVVVKEAMQEGVETTEPGATLRDAAAQMMERKIGCLPVVDKGKLVGILTEGDFVKLFSRQGS